MSAISVSNLRKGKCFKSSGRDSKVGTDEFSWL